MTMIIHSYKQSFISMILATSTTTLSEKKSVHQTINDNNNSNLEDVD